jgi:hypothetical protein
MTEPVFKYVVVTLYNGEYPEAHVTLLTGDLVQAIDHVRNDVRSTKDIWGRDTTAYVKRIREGTVYDRKGQDIALIFVAGNGPRGAEWTEEWRKDSARKEYEAKKKAAAEVVPDEEDLRDSRDVHPHPNSQPTI